MMARAKRRTPDGVSPLMEALRTGVLLVPAFVKLPAKGRGKIGLRAALILSQAWYMSKRTGNAWEYSPADWIEGTGLSDDQLTRALRVLVDAGYLDRCQRSRVRVMTYSLDLLTLERALISCAPITAESRICKTAESRTCKTAKSRLSLYGEDAFSKEKACGRKPSQTAQQVARMDPGNHARTVPEIGTTRERWEAYARSLSPAWVESGDAGSCWDDMAGAGWKDSGRRLVYDWEAKARRYLKIWRTERGGAKAEERAKIAAAAAGSIAAELEDARKRLSALEVLAAAGDWAGVRAGEATWRAANSRTFAAYIDRKRPRSWAQNIAALAAGSPQKPKTPPRS